MGRKGKKIKSSGEGGIVYSTNSNFGFGDLLANALGNEPDSEKTFLKYTLKKKGVAAKQLLS